MSGILKTILYAGLVAMLAGCGAQPAMPPASRPCPRYMLTSHRDAVEFFFDAIHAGDIAAMRSIVTQENSHGIGGRTWELWVKDFANVHISRYAFRISELGAAEDREALHVVLSNGEEMTFFGAAVAGQYHISKVDRRREAATQP